MASGTRLEVRVGHGDWGINRIIGNYLESELNSQLKLKKGPSRGHRIVSQRESTMPNAALAERHLARPTQVMLGQRERVLEGQRRRTRRAIGAWCVRERFTPGDALQMVRSPGGHVQAESRLDATLFSEGY